MPMMFSPAPGYVAVVRNDKATVSKGGILIPDAATPDGLLTGRADTTWVEFVEPDDTVYYKFPRAVITFEGQEFDLVHEDDILAVYGWVSEEDDDDGKPVFLQEEDNMQSTLSH